MTIVLISMFSFRNMTHIYACLVLHLLVALACFFLYTTCYWQHTWIVRVITYILEVWYAKDLMIYLYWVCMVIIVQVKHVLTWVCFFKVFSVCMLHEWPWPCVYGHLVLVDAYVYMCNSSCFGIYHEYLFMMVMLSC